MFNHSSIISKIIVLLFLISATFLVHSSPATRKNVHHHRQANAGREFYQQVMSNPGSDEVLLFNAANHTLLMPSLHHIDSAMYFPDLQPRNLTSSSSSSSSNDTNNNNTTQASPFAPNLFYTSEDRRRLIFNGF